MNGDSELEGAKKDKTLSVLIQQLAVIMET